MMTFRYKYNLVLILNLGFAEVLFWQDECRASINAAKTAQNLTEKDKSNLVMDAIYRAKEFGHLIEMDDFMKNDIQKGIAYATES